MVTTVLLETKRVRSSTWPCVSSPRMPRPSQIVCGAAQVIGECFFVVGTNHVRVALLLLAKQAFFGGENGARSVDVDGSAFKNNAV